MGPADGGGGVTHHLTSAIREGNCFVVLLDPGAGADLCSVERRLIENRTQGQESRQLPPDKRGGA